MLTVRAVDSVGLLLLGRQADTDEHLFLMHTELPFFMVDINWNLCLHVAKPPGDGSYFTATAIWVTEKSTGYKVPLRNTSGGLSFI